MKIVAISYRFRWPIEQTGETEITVQIPLAGDAPPLFNPEAVRRYALSVQESEDAEYAALKEIAIIR